MSKFFNIIFLFFISFSALYSSEYTAVLLSPELPPGRIYAINDHEQTLISPEGSSNLYLYDKKTGLTTIENKSEINNPVTLNNMGQVLGYGCRAKAYGSRYFEPFIWSKDVGVQWLDVFGSKSVSLKDLNDLGQIIGSYKHVGKEHEFPSRPFMWENGVATDMGLGSEFAKSIENLGYHVMEINLKSINNKGELAGYFGYGKLNTKTQKYVLVGYENFYWNGNIQIISLPIAINIVLEEMKLNDRGSVMIVANPSSDLTKTYLWGLDNGVKIIDDFMGRCLNNSDVIFGVTPFNLNPLLKPLLWKDGKVNNFENLLGVEDIFHMAPYCSDSYEIEKLMPWEFRSMNNKGQITCLGSIWGDLYPCLLETSE